MLMKQRKDNKPIWSYIKDVKYSENGYGDRPILAIWLDVAIKNNNINIEKEKDLRKVISLIVGKLNLYLVTFGKMCKSNHANNPNQEEIRIFFKDAKSTPWYTACYNLKKKLGKNWQTIIGYQKKEMQHQSNKFKTNKRLKPSKYQLIYWNKNRKMEINKKNNAYETLNNHSESDSLTMTTLSYHN